MCLTEAEGPEPTGPASPLLKTSPRLAAAWLARFRTRTRALLAALTSISKQKLPDQAEISRNPEIVAPSC